MDVCAMEVQTKFLRLTRPVTLGKVIDGWRVCWLGGWDKGKVLFVVMVERSARHVKHVASVRKPHDIDEPRHVLVRRDRLETARGIVFALRRVRRQYER